MVLLIFIALFRWPNDRNLLEYKIRNLINSEDSQALIDYFNTVCPGIYNINSLVNFILGMFATTETFSNKMFVEFNENALSRLPETEVECIKVRHLKLVFFCRKSPENICTGWNTLDAVINSTCYEQIFLSKFSKNYFY